MRWHVFTKDGREFVAQFLISGAGGLHIPLIPEFDGSRRVLATGRAAFHSAQWDHDVDLTGKRVAVIGTGASAIQIVPEIVKDVAAAAALPAHPGMGDAAAEQSDPRGHAAGVHQRAGHPGGHARRHLLAARGGRVRDDQAAAAAQDRRDARQVEHPAVDQGPGAAPQAHPGLPGRLQANPELRHLLSRHRRPEDRGDHRPHRAVHRRRASSPPTATRDARWTSWCSPPASTSPTPTPTSTSRARAARTWSTAGTPKASRRCAASPSPTCRTCSSCSARTPRWATTRWSS